MPSEKARGQQQQTQSKPDPESMKKTGGYAINCVDNMEMNDPRGGGMCFSTDDDIAVVEPVIAKREEIKREEPKTMMIDTTGQPQKE